MNCKICSIAIDDFRVVCSNCMKKYERQMEKELKCEELFK